MLGNGSPLVSKRRSTIPWVSTSDSRSVQENMLKSSQVWQYDKVYCPSDGKHRLTVSDSMCVFPDNGCLIM